MVIFLRSFSKARLHFGLQSTIYAAVVELVDTRDSKSREGNLMSVRARPAVPGIISVVETFAQVCQRAMYGRRGDRS